MSQTSGPTAAEPMIEATLHRRLPPSARVYTALAGNALVLALAAHMALAA